MTPEQLDEITRRYLQTTSAEIEQRLASQAAGRGRRQALLGGRARPVRTGWLRGYAASEAAVEVINGVVPRLEVTAVRSRSMRRATSPCLFNISGMYRGWVKADGSRGTAIFRRE